MATQYTIDNLPLLEVEFPGAFWTIWRGADEIKPRIDLTSWLSDLGLEDLPDLDEDEAPAK